MSLSALDDLAVEPTDIQVSAVLKGGTEAWVSLVSWLSNARGVDGWEWFSSGKKYGWALRGKKKKRTIVYMIPQHGSFLVGLVLGDRAMAAVRRASLSAGVRNVISDAKKYGEGTGFRLPVADMGELEDVKTLIEIKLAY
jgi:hypothetical protein